MISSVPLDDMVLVVCTIVMQALNFIISAFLFVSSLQLASLDVHTELHEKVVCATIYPHLYFLLYASAMLPITLAVATFGMLTMEFVMS